MNALHSLLTPYNPWWSSRQWPDELQLPAYERPVVRDILSDLQEIPQMISVTGPRRVGKSTAVRQVIRNLIDTGGIEPHRILYFSFDDPEVIASQDLQRSILDDLVRLVLDRSEQRASSSGARAYLFLDEIQRLPRWELYLKKHYDLKTPVRFVVSGSASSPIFRASQESLLGRVKDRHLLPFSFREFCEYRLRNTPEHVQLLQGYRRLRPYLLEADGAGAASFVNQMHQTLEPCRQDINNAILDYCADGGFPEVWALADPVRKIEYLMQQQVHKVLYEDLMILTQYRKPENVLRFFVYLLAHPGVEVNIAKIAGQSGVERRVVEENLPRLEMTDLIMRIQKFSHKPLRVRQGNIKTYPIDMALRNAVMKTWERPDLGIYFENLVARELNGWPEKIELSYFREKNREIDFVLAFGGSHYLPIEVKSGSVDNEFRTLHAFMKKYDVPLGVVITSDREARYSDRLLFLPLRYFLLGC